MRGPSEFERTGTLKRYDRVEALARVSVPTLLICGEYDETTPLTCIGYANRMESCAYAEVKGASHAIWEEKPKQMKRIIDALLGDLD